MITFIKELLAERKSRGQAAREIRIHTVEWIRKKVRRAATDGWVHVGFGCATLSSDSKGLWLSELESILDEVAK